MKCFVLQTAADFDDTGSPDKQYLVARQEQTTKVHAYVQVVSPLLTYTASSKQLESRKHITFQNERRLDIMEEWQQQTQTKQRTQHRQKK